MRAIAPVFDGTRACRPSDLDLRVREPSGPLPGEQPCKPRRASLGDTPKRRRNALAKRPASEKPQDSAMSVMERARLRGVVQVLLAARQALLEDEVGQALAFGGEQPLQQARRHALAARDSRGVSSGSRSDRALRLGPTDAQLAMRAAPPRRCPGLEQRQCQQVQRDVRQRLRDVGARLAAELVDGDAGEPAERGGASTGRLM